MYNQRQIVLPAGIDIGRFIVDSLDIMPDPVRKSDIFFYILREIITWFVIFNVLDCGTQTD